MRKEGYKFEEVNAGEEGGMTIAEKFNIMSAPAFVFINDKGKTVKILQGITDDISIKKYA